MNDFLKRLLRRDNGCKKRFAFIFICQQGEWEIKALLLAASLKKHLACDCEMIAALPAPAKVWGVPGEGTLSLFRRLGVRTVPVENGINPRHTHANKIACTAIAAHAEKMIFLDSDMLCLRDFSTAPRMEGQIALKPADLQTFTQDEEIWRLAYSAAGVEMPEERIPSTFSGEPGPPYFNSGFIAWDSGISLAEMWLECARVLDKTEGLPVKEPWSDQPSLAIALERLGLRRDVLDERYNFPAHLRALDANHLPWFCHYHYPEVIAREPVLSAAVREYAAAYAEIRALMESHEAWRRFA